MNSVSWFIYAAEVMEGLKVLLIIGILAAAFTLLFFTLILGLEKNKFVPGFFRYVFFLFLAGLGVVLIPSQNAIYAIAASEVGERIIRSEQVLGVADDATKALRQWIKRQIEPEKQQK